MTMQSPAGSRERRALQLPRVPRHLVFALAATALAFALPADATTYKWVDDWGQVHYTDQPPPGVQYEIVAMPKPASTRSTRSRSCTSASVNGLRATAPAVRVPTCGLVTG